MENENQECTHDCSTCGVDCPSKGGKENASMLESPNHLSNIDHVVAVVSGKGGVGKSLVTSLLACETSRRGLRTAVLDADITGPSIPKMFGIKPGVTGCEDGMFPPVSKTGIEVMSVNLLLDDEKVPVVWRGPVIAGTVKQFWTDVIWGDIEWMYVDMPPGTGDVPLTVFQSLPVNGIVIVTSPQELVSMIVEKAVRMAQMMKIPVLGIVENMSYAVCPHCNEKISVFGESHVDEVAAQYGIPVIARIPLNTEFALSCDKGEIESVNADGVSAALDKILETVNEAK